MASKCKDGDNHTSKIARLCRLCGNPLAVGNGYSPDVAKFTDTLSIMYHLNFEGDVTGIHPPKMCSRCHASIGHFKSGSAPSLITIFDWQPHVDDQCVVCKKQRKGGRPKTVRKQPGRPVSSESINVTDLINWNPKKRIPPAVEKAMSQLVKVKKQQSPSTIITFNSGGPNPCTLAPLTVAKKDSSNVSSRTLRKRTKQQKDLMSITSGSSSAAITSQTAHLVKSLDSTDRDEILDSFKKSITIPEEHVAAMKSTLNLSWNLLRDVRRWLQTFKVNLSSEEKSRNVVKNWVGEGLCCEEVPAAVLKAKKMTIELREW